ncbi:ATP-binding cassette domain-containing protein, partial [Candidatus Bipolaricaulota bacterium]|nr:ATP-binding cassette domain-containing protein [Candidatus Bipolaricaulota bacterium]
LELEEALAGLRQIDSGSIYLGEREISDTSTREKRGLGIAHIPSDRLKRGMVPEFPLDWNLILGSEWKQPFASKGLLNKTEIEENRESVIDQFDIRGAEGNPAGKSLSGGNQQKLILGRELTRDPSMIIAAQPTRGVDVGAKEYIHRELLEMRDQGVPVLLISAELDELRALSDRLMVIYEGEILVTADAGELSENELGLLMAGENREEAKASENN